MKTRNLSIRTPKIWCWKFFLMKKLKWEVCFHVISQRKSFRRECFVGLFFLKELMDLFKGVILWKHCVNIQPNFFPMGSQFIDEGCRYDQPISMGKIERNQHAPLPPPVKMPGRRRGETSGSREGLYVPRIPGCPWGVQLGIEKIFMGHEQPAVFSIASPRCRCKPE